MPAYEVTTNRGSVRIEADNEKEAGEIAAALYPNSKTSRIEKTKNRENIIYKGRVVA